MDFFLSCKQTVICIQFFLITIHRAVFVCFRLVDECMFPGTSCCSLDHRCGGMRTCLLSISSILIVMLLEILAEHAA